MNKILYRYICHGRDGDGKEWNSSGLLSAPGFPEALEEAQKRTFMDLTQGLAVYGKPGEGGCNGPYRITGLHVHEQAVTRVS